MKPIRGIKTVFPDGIAVAGTYATGSPIEAESRRRDRNTWSSSHRNHRFSVGTTYGSTGSAVPRRRRDVVEDAGSLREQQRQRLPRLHRGRHRFHSFVADAGWAPTTTGCPTSTPCADDPLWQSFTEPKDWPSSAVDEIMAWLAEATRPSTTARSTTGCAAGWPSYTRTTPTTDRDLREKEEDKEVWTPPCWISYTRMTPTTDRDLPEKEEAWTPPCWTSNTRTTPTTERDLREREEPEEVWTPPYWITYTRMTPTTERDVREKEDEWVPPCWTTTSCGRPTTTEDRWTPPCRTTTCRAALDPRTTATRRGPPTTNPGRSGTYPVEESTSRRRYPTRRPTVVTTDPSDLCVFRITNCTPPSQPSIRVT